MVHWVHKVQKMMKHYFVGALFQTQGFQDQKWETFLYIHFQYRHHFYFREAVYCNQLMCFAYIVCGKLWRPIRIDFTYPKCRCKYYGGILWTIRGSGFVSYNLSILLQIARIRKAGFNIIDIMNYFGLIKYLAILR